MKSKSSRLGKFKRFLKRGVVITGSIACGKSAVCSHLKERGFCVIDADFLAHKILDNSARQIGRIFGREFVRKQSDFSDFASAKLDANLSQNLNENLSKNPAQKPRKFSSKFAKFKAKFVDRKKLGATIFKDSFKKKKLENLIHKKVKFEILKKSIKNELEIKRKNSNLGVYFIDIPLFFETKNYNEFEKVAGVWAPKDLILRRLMERNNLSQNEAILRINSQINVDEKAKKADFVIKNDGDKKALLRATEQFLENLKDKNADFKI